MVAVIKRVCGGATLAQKRRKWAEGPLANGNLAMKGERRGVSPTVTSRAQFASILLRTIFLNLRRQRRETSRARFASISIEAAPPATSAQRSIEVQSSSPTRLVKFRETVENGTDSKPVFEIRNNRPK